MNHLLRHADGRRIAVMVNDFGELTIDADLIEGAEGSVLALAGGCVCCSFGSDLLGALQDVLQRQPPPDLILIETSGVALPAAVARSARLLPGLSIDGIVLMLDAETVRQRSADPYVGDLVRQQLLDADLLILNKTELCSPTALAELTRLAAHHDHRRHAGGTCQPGARAAGIGAGFSRRLGCRPGGRHRRRAGALGWRSPWAAQPIGQPLAAASDRFVNELLELSAPLDPQAPAGKA